MAVLCALVASPGGVTTVGIAARAQISPAAARQALTRLEKAGTVTRTRAGRPGADTTRSAPAFPVALSGES